MIITKSIFGIFYFEIMSSVYYTQFDYKHFHQEMEEMIIQASIEDSDELNEPK